MAAKWIPVDEFEEFDDGTRECEISLYARQVDDPRVKMIAGKDPPLSCQHWAVVTYFERGDRYLTFEAGEDENGKLRAKVMNGIWPESTGTGKIYKIILGTLQTSPKKLVQLAKMNSKNDTNYIAIGNNCQDWVDGFIDGMSSKLKSALLAAKVKGFNLWIEVGKIPAKVLGFSSAKSSFSSFNC